MRRSRPYKTTGDGFNRGALREFIHGTGVLVGFDPERYPELLQKRQWLIGIRTFLGTGDAEHTLGALRRHELVTASRVMDVPDPEDGVDVPTLRRRIAKLVSNDADYDGESGLRKKELKYLAVALAGNHHHPQETSVTTVTTRPRTSPKADVEPPTDGVDVREPRDLPTYDEDDLTQHLQELADDLGRPPSVTDINQSDGPSATVYYNRYEDIFQARDAAGVGHPDSARRLRKAALNATPEEIGDAE